MPARFERRAQAADMHIHRALLDEHMIAPDLVEQLRARMDTLGVGHQEVQQAELGRAEADFLAVGGNTVGRRIQAQTTEFDRILGRLRRVPPQHGLDPRHQLARAEGLGDVIVGAKLEAVNLVALAGAGGEHDDRQAPGAHVAAQQTGENRCRSCPAASSRAAPDRATRPAPVAAPFRHPAPAGHCGRHDAG
jgi:hypothetical protein